MTDKEKILNIIEVRRAHYVSRIASLNKINNNLDLTDEDKAQWDFRRLPEYEYACKVLESLKIWIEDNCHAKE
jgi:hypothetical protein